MAGPTASAGLNLLRMQLFYHPPLPSSDFSGQTVIVTGGNAGLGREAAGHVARLNAAHLIIACRTASKGEEAREWIARQTKSSTEIQVWPLDQSSFASVGRIHW
jgi:retinol dehydrogenase-12